ncbi:MAG: hydrogenase maturation nickel metallochaperone HypA [Planctomycetes bacterium]|uniref:hydrogenase maturation nickel metallochaperone HypA/HybF n=1 Tax=Candidatus Wunengus sp. YC65 TaxID=3367701 RepID=UPI001DE31101|nr:hydrogenase maturation nickel metallochaperone HypA [Planctomycetota bacterium]
MHEFSLIKDLIRKISTIAHEQHASKIISVTVKLGALSHISPDHFRDHFVLASRGTITEGARLNINVIADKTDPLAQDIILESIDVDVQLYT